MKKFTLPFLVLFLSWQASALELRDRALAILTTGYSTESTIKAPKFAFYESCERMYAKVYGADPISGDTREISLMILRKRWPEGQKTPPRRSVLILPPTGGVNQLDIQYAEQLCDKGIEGWVVTAWDKNQKDYRLDHDLLSHDNTGLRGISAIRQIVPHMRGELGVLGTSAGGILAAVALAVEPRFKTGVLIAAGADIPEIVASSDLDSLRALRRDRMEIHGWTSDEYKTQLREAILLDPSLFHQELATKIVGTVVAFRDRTVPIRQQLFLEDLCGARRITSFDDDHVTAIIKTGLLDSYKIINFFRRHL